MEHSRAIVVANAPISFGAFELTVGINPGVPEATGLLDQVRDAGYAGIDLGPAGYLGEGELLRERFESRGLGLAGGYLELPFTDPLALEEQWGLLDELLTIFDAVEGLSPAPKPTLADCGSPVRKANPGASAIDPSYGWSDEDWKRFAEGFAKVHDYCRQRGYEPTIHNETGSHIEAPWELERVMELTDAGICLDTGHLAMSGGDSVQAIRDWKDRINHVHVKDARLSILRGIREDGGDTDEIWKRRAFCALGEGDLPLDGILDAIRSIGYQGWLVVEQDIFPEPTDPEGWAAGQQRANREFLRARGI